ncbi:MAG: hypothetical protein JWN76_2520 [Chitinophagaceae bacterium]|nr:hypothetical protein [Chitinophagaceae bacterium]
MSTHNELHKEFELERMILFSDAVFAIAITLLIIEIKFPEIEKGASAHEVWKAFKPVVIRFLGFMLSFFFIGMVWARHLKLFKYLRRYNNGVIARNLVFLFFIVCFPLTASGITEHIRPGFLLPITLYLINLACVAIAQYILCSYMFSDKRTLAMPGFAAEKKYILLQSSLGAMALGMGVAVEVTLSSLFPQQVELPLYSMYVIPVIMFIGRRFIKKYKPAKTAD